MYIRKVSDELIIPEKNLKKEERYQLLYPQLEALIAGEKDLFANLGNLCAALKEAMGFLWIGFYRVEGDELVLSSFQGPVACTRIKKGKGVCGKAWELNETILVPNVDEFPGHIACSSASKSEIVIPIVKDQKVVFILDVDSNELNHFDKVDEAALQKIAVRIAALL